MIESPYESLAWFTGGYLLGALAGWISIWLAQKMVSASSKRRVMVDRNRIWGDYGWISGPFEGTVLAEAPDAERTKVKLDNGYIRWFYSRDVYDLKESPEKGSNDETMAG